jgi:hypothetical protein
MTRFGTGPWRRWAWVAAAAVIGVGALALWLIPLALTSAPAAGLSSAERLKAVNDARQAVLAFLVVVGAGGTLWFTARSYLLNRESNLTDRFTKAVAQLGDDTVHVRVGAVYALERIAQDSLRDRRTAIWVLGSFIRGQSRLTRARDDALAEDVYTALRTVTRLVEGTDLILDLRGADLRNADLSHLRADQTWLKDADTTGAALPARPKAGHG